jgi:enoyl-CoA hydratase
MGFQNIIAETEEGIGIIEINRPKKLNALNQETISELHQAFDELDKDPETRAIILTGSGEKAFVAGADISEFADFGPGQGKELSYKGQKNLFDFIEQLGTPVIAAINGFALGGGLELAMACHIRVASHTARMGLPEVSLGLIPGYGGTQRLPQLVGKGKALEMILTGGMISSKEVLKWGLVNHLADPEELLDFCYELAQKIITNSPQAIRAAIKAVNAGFQEGVDGYQKEVDLFGSCFGTKDFNEGTSAFMEKRKPKF